MKIAFYINDTDSTNGGARPLINWAKQSLNDSVLIAVSPKMEIPCPNFINAESIAEIVELLKGYDFLVVSDNHVKEGIKIKKMTGLRLVVYSQVPFGLHALGVKGKGENSMERFAFFVARSLPFRLISHNFVRRLSSADLLIANSSTMDTILSFVYGINASSIVAPPVDINEFHPEDYPTKDSILVFTGRKGDLNDYAILAKLADISEEKGLKLQVFGNGDIPDHIKNRISKSNFHQKIPTKELVTLYSRSIVTVAIQELEFFGYVPVESISCGTPAITIYQHVADQGPFSLNKCIRRSSIESIQTDIEEIIRHPSPIQLREECRKTALNYSSERSVAILKKTIETVRRYHSNVY